MGTRARKLNKSVHSEGQIAFRALMINARNDPFLAAACYPTEEAEQNPNLHLEMPLTGGHVGFMNFSGEYWSETRAVAFLATGGYSLSHRMGEG